MTRPYCRQPASCHAGRRGRCATCQPLNPEVRARKSAAMKAAMADPEVRARHAAAISRARLGFDIPKWVRDAGLDDDYRSVGVEQGEEAAAAHCRRLKRETAGASP